MTARDVIREALIIGVPSSPTTKTNLVLQALTAAGYRLIGPGELDQETIERCAVEVDGWAESSRKVAERENDPDRRSYHLLQRDAHTNAAASLRALQSQEAGNGD